MQKFLSPEVTVHGGLSFKKSPMDHSMTCQPVPVSKAFVSKHPPLFPDCTRIKTLSPHPFQAFNKNDMSVVAH